MGELEECDYEASIDRMKSLVSAMPPLDAEELLSKPERIDLWLKAWGVPLRMRRLVRGGLNETKAVRVVNEYIDTPEEAWCLTVGADKGTGKSTAAAKWLTSFIDHDPDNVPNNKTPNYWFTGPGLTRINNYDVAWEKVMHSRVMVLDDLGVEYIDKNENFLTRLDELIYVRHGEFLPTLITTNLNSEDFEKRYGDRVFDRICEGFDEGGGFCEINLESMRV